MKDNDKKEEIYIPPDLQAELDARPKSKKAFEQLPLSHRRECAEAIEAAAMADTRDRRVKRTLEMLEEKANRK